MPHHEQANSKPDYEETNTKPDQGETNSKPDHEETNSKPDLEETNTKIDLTECFKFDAGYSKPPRGSWFVKGTSGNPGGRPKGSKNKPQKLNDKNFNEILRAELFKKVKVKGERTATVSAVKAVTQSMMDLAIGGNLRAIQLVFTSIRAVEAADAAQQEADYNYAVAYKASCANPISLLYEGLNRPMPVPSPDHVILDHRNRRVMFRGPRNEEEMAKFLAGENFREEATGGDEINENETADDDEKYAEPLPYQRDTLWEGDDRRLRTETQ